jgi:hypothetical protein
MVNESCMRSCLIQKSVPYLYQEIIVQEAVKAYSCSALATALRMKGIPQAWIDLAVQCCYQCGGR